MVGRSAVLHMVFGLVPIMLPRRRPAVKGTDVSSRLMSSGVRPSLRASAVRKFTHRQATATCAGGSRIDLSAQRRRDGPRDGDPVGRGPVTDIGQLRRPTGSGGPERSPACRESGGEQIRWPTGSSGAKLR